jgi:hypothetical protein
MAAPPRVFLLSPARLDGPRAKMLFEPRTSFTVAAGLRRREGIAIGQVFAFVSGLYFRGKLAYGQRFAVAPAGEDAAWTGSGALVITQSRGLVPVESRVCLEHLEEFAQVDVNAKERGFTTPLLRDARRLAAHVADGGEVVLLGSIAQPKYVEPLLEALGERLCFPVDFVGRGDMSRGGLMLRAAESGTELTYGQVAGAVRHGKRPAKLTPRRRSP